MLVSLVMIFNTYYGALVATETFEASVLPFSNLTAFFFYFLIFYEEQFLWFKLALFQQTNFL